MDKLRKVFGIVANWFKRQPKISEAERLQALIKIALENELLSVQLGDLAFTVNPGYYQPESPALNLEALKSKTAEEIKAERERLLFWSTK
jgi:hypothetical protein